MLRGGCGRCGAGKHFIVVTHLLSFMSRAFSILFLVSRFPSPSIDKAVPTFHLDANIQSVCIAIAAAKCAAFDAKYRG
jgi:hypothetical protein